MKDTNTVEKLIAAEQAKLNKLEEKRANISEKIKVCKTNIDKYIIMRNSQQYNSLSNALDEKGINIEEILEAISKGDLISLQEKIEVGK